MTLYVLSIVEGETEEGCINTLLTRIWSELLQRDMVEPLIPLEPLPANRSSIVKEGHPDLAKKIEQAFRTVGRKIKNPEMDRGWILLLLDADDDCPKELGPRLLERTTTIRSDADIACVIAIRELENWFTAAAESLAGVNGLPPDLQTPVNPEDSPGDNWLDRQLKRQNPKRKYAKPTDAKIFAQQMDLDQCRTN